MDNISEQGQIVASSGVGIQVVGDNVTINIDATRLALSKRHLLKAPRLCQAHELLLTDLRATQLVGRDADLAALDAWLHGSRPVAVRCLIGAAGSGKTRLAIELCEHAEAGGWITGFATRKELDRFSAAQSLEDWRWPGPTLIVVDDAATCQSILRDWFEALAHQTPRRQKLRFLLLERHAALDHGWWARLICPGSTSGRGPDELADPQEPIVLPGLSNGQDRRSLLDQACSIAAEIIGVAAPTIPPPGADAAFDNRLAEDGLETAPLFLMMAGIVGAQTGLPQALALRADELANRLAMSERQRIDRLSRSWGIDAGPGPAKLEHLVACVTLQGGCTRAEAIALIREEWNAMGWPVGPPADWIATRLAETLHRSQDGVSPIQPDRIGEAFLVNALTKDGRPAVEQCQIVARAWLRNRGYVTAMVVRTVQDHAIGRSNHPSRAWLDHLLATVPDFRGLVILFLGMPHETIVLRERAVRTLQRLISAVLQQDRQSGQEARLAGWLDELGIRHLSLGQPEQALEAATRAMTIYHRLCDQHSGKFTAQLAGAFETMARIYLELRRPADALCSAERAAGIRRRMASSSGTRTASELSVSLTVRTNVLGAVGQHEKALVPAREALSLLRGLEKRFPGGFPQQLAAAHCNLGRALCRVGCHKAGLRELDQATIDYAILTAKQPDAFEPALAWSHIGRANALRELGRFDEAIAAERTAIAIQRRLAKIYPEFFQADLAEFLGNQAGCLHKVRRFDEATAVAEEAVTIHRTLAASSSRYRTNMIASLCNLAVIQSETGRQGAAVATADEAYAITCGRNRNGDEDGEVAASCYALAGALRAIGRYHDASRAARKATVLYRRLVVHEPDRFRPELARTMWRRARCLDAMDQTASALAQYVEAISNLAVCFAQSPRAFVSLIMGVATDYIGCCIRRDTAVDKALIAPLLSVRLSPRTGYVGED